MEKRIVEQFAFGKLLEIFASLSVVRPDAGDYAAAVNAARDAAAEEPVAEEDEEDAAEQEQKGGIRCGSIFRASSKGDVTSHLGRTPFAQAAALDDPSGARP